MSAPTESAFREGVAHHRAGRLTEAIALYRRALAWNPALPEVQANLGNALVQQGRLEEAVAAYRAALAVRPDFADGHYNLANALKAQGRFDEAVTSYRKALTLDPAFAEAHVNLGNTLSRQGRPGEAIASFRAALALKPDFAAARYNLAAAHNNLGHALREKGRHEEAMESYRAAIDTRPDFADACYGLGYALCERHRIAEGAAWFTRGAELVFGGQAARDAKPEPPHKMRHDREQRVYLSGAADDARLTEGFHIAEGARLAGSAINLGNDIGGIETQWRTKQPQIVVIDDFLTPEALAGLRAFCLGSTIWRELFHDGYLGARPETGFACPLVAQVAQELRVSYPGIFRDHPLLYSWSFKYDDTLKGTNVHADFAAVNVNFWITPDEANLDPESGGLVVWDVAAPLDWNFDKYNTDKSTIRDFLVREKAISMRIPYRANRAVIFDSDLFHETDRMNFKPGYKNCRINITLLYGRRGA